MAVELYGYQYSVYSWIARLALEEKGQAAQQNQDTFRSPHSFVPIPKKVSGPFVGQEGGHRLRGAVAGEVQRQRQEADQHGLQESPPARFAGAWFGLEERGKGRRCQGSLHVS